MAIAKALCGARPMRRPGIDPPHVAWCVLCNRVHEWFGLRRDGGKDVKGNFVCSDCLWAERKAQAAAASSQGPFGAGGDGQ